MKTSDLEKKILAAAVEQLNAEFNAAIEPLLQLVHADRMVSVKLGSRKTHKVPLRFALEGARNLYLEAHVDRREMEIMESLIDATRSKPVASKAVPPPVFRILEPKEITRAGDEIYNIHSEEWEPIVLGKTTGHSIIRRPTNPIIRVPWYRLLSDGEEILKGDEWFRTPDATGQAGEWKKVDVFSGTRFSAATQAPHRRLMKGSGNHTADKVEWIQVLKGPLRTSDEIFDFETKKWESLRVKVLGESAEDVLKKYIVRRSCNEVPHGFFRILEPGETCQATDQYFSGGMWWNALPGREIASNCYPYRRPV